MTDLICRQVQKASATIGPAIHKLPSAGGFDLLDFDPEGGRFGAAPFHLTVGQVRNCDWRT
jgi:hypothetical protein